MLRNMTDIMQLSRISTIHGAVALIGLITQLRRRYKVIISGHYTNIILIFHDDALQDIKFAPYLVPYVQAKGKSIKLKGREGEM